jgi:hypothetical protein
MIKELLGLAAIGFFSWGASATERESTIVSINNNTNKYLSVCVGVKGSDSMGSFDFSYSRPIGVQPLSLKNVKKTDINQEFQRNCQLTGVQVLVEGERAQFEKLGKTVTVTYDEEKHSYTLTGTDIVDPKREKTAQEVMEKYYAKKRKGKSGGYNRYY